MSETINEKRKWLPALPELIDRLSIVTLKSIKLEHKEYYEKEAEELMHDIHLILKEDITKIQHYGKLVRAIQIGCLANEIIWSNETKARLGEGTQDHLLPLTHSINGLRMTAGNAISNQTGTKKDLNVDRLNKELCKKFGYDFSGLFE